MFQFVFDPLCKKRPCGGLIPRQRHSTSCVLDYETEKLSGPNNGL